MYPQKPISELDGSVCIVIAAKTDIHADAVVDKIRGEAIIVRLDPFDNLPYLSLHADSNSFCVGAQRIALDKVVGVLCRVALEAVNYNHIVDSVEKFSAHEHFSALIGLLLQVSEDKWINYPWNESRADGKIYPLLIAKECGIRVPNFICDSDARRLTAFARQGPVIIKPFSDMSIARQRGRFVEIPDFEEFSAPYTCDFDASVLEHSDQTTPVLLQNKIEANFEVRAVVVDSKIFATKIERDKMFVDSRMQKKRIEQIYEIGDELARRILCLVTRRLKLRFVAMDFLVDQEGVLNLIDVNPSGNWLWQEQNFGLEISGGIAQALLK